ncbi:MAG: Dyp-type peroxidase [Campylobacteraceae bacterium]|jgi:putative iron-dependent peroxidase|nr:Dyp-type peroxidase [Campylobacteraceae bacterium]
MDANPQDVTRSPGSSAIFMVYGLNSDKSANDTVKELCGEFAAIVRSMRKRYPESYPSAVFGFGAEAWDRLFPQEPRPKELEIFKGIKGAKHTAPSTKGDLFFHVRAQNMDVAYELSAIISSKLEGAVYHIDEVHGFRYFDGRTIIGFVDGTENPENDDAVSFGVIGDEDEYFNGGSYAFVQKYLHDMKAWNELPLEEQEKVIGRRRYTDEELGDDVKPANAHNAVTNITDENGNELKIIRANMPFANPSKGEFGTYFIGYAGTFSTTKKMLENMFKGGSEGNYDRLLDFSKPVTGTLFFVPSWELLEKIAE